MKRTQKSQKRTKFLFLLIVLTAILSITATYAWFSTQRDVEITGMRLNVEVAESMQISLNGETWVQSITIEDMKQFYNTYSANTSAHQAVSIGESTTNLNYVPIELLPVSSDGTVTNGKLNFVTGTINGTTLEEVKACSEDDITKTDTIADRQNGNTSHPYLVFDMYLRNISAKTGSNKDTLKLNKGSRVFVNADSTEDDTQMEGAGVANTGLEYSARVGFVLYGNTVSVNSTSATLGEDVRTIAATGSETAAIWEPNDKEHTIYVVNNDLVGLTASSQAFTTSALKYTTSTADIENIYTSATAIQEVNTMKPEYNTDGSVKDAVEITDVNAAKVQLVPNTISKVRVYVWLEGQDPDCIDLASTGDKLNIDIKLTKDQTSTTDITYAN